MSIKKKVVNIAVVFAVVLNTLSFCFGGFVDIANAVETPDASITSFSFSGNEGVVSLNSIILSVPLGTDVSSIAPTIGFTGASISPASGVPQDFTNPVTYTVTAGDGSATVYTVLINFAEASTQATLAVEKNNFVGDSVVNPGATHILVGSYKITVNDLEDVRLESIKINFSQNSVYDNISLEDVGGDAIGEVGYQSPDGSVAFSGLNYVLRKSQTKIINIRADVLPFATGRIASTLGDIQATGNKSGTSITTPQSVVGQTITSEVVADPLQNHAPVAVDDQIMVYKNNGLLFDVFDNDIDDDGDSLSLQSMTQPAHGQIELISLNGSYMSYMAEKDYIGPDSFDYTVSDERGGLDTATVMITVKELFPPIVLDDTAITNENTAVTINVLDNDSDPNGGTLDIKEVSNPAHGSAVINSSSIIYTPSFNYFGTDTFTYSVSFGKGDSVSAAVTVIVGKVLHKKGADNALISLEVRIDYQCPYSMQFQSTLNKVLDEYQEKVNFYIKHFPLSAMHPNAWKAAEAAECANDQGDDHFWQMNDWFVSKAADFTTDDVKNFAATLSHFDSQLFNSCLDSGSKHQVIQEYINGGSDITGTPTTYVRRNSDGQFKKVEGAVSYEDLKKVIDSLIQILTVPGAPNIEPVNPINVNSSTLYKVIIDPGDNSTSSEKTTFAVRLQIGDAPAPCIDEFASCEEDVGVVYMQTDGSWGHFPVWFTYDELGGQSGKIMKDLVGDTKYYISVAARNSDGNETAYGATMQFNLGWTIPPEPVTLSNITTSSVTINWNSGGGTEHEFLVQHWDNSNPDDPTYQTLVTIPVSASTTSYSYTISGLMPNTAYNEYYYRIAAQDNVSAAYSYAPSFKILSLPDTTPPVVTPPSSGGSSGGGGGGGSIQAPAFIAPAVIGFSAVINNGATETNSANVNLTLSGGAAARMAISNSSDFSNISQEAYQTTKAWKLSDGLGEKTVYVKFYDQNGANSPIVSATIKLVGITPISTGQVLGIKITRTDELIVKLKFGQRGTEVNELQNELKRLGFLPKGYKTTFYYGNITATGVAKYGASKKQVLGVKMVNIDNLIAVTKFCERSGDVKLLQGELKKNGFYPKNWLLTGYYGPVTKAGVEKYLASSK